MILLFTALGDSYGAGFEYASDLIVSTFNDASGYVPHPKHKLAPGVYTDDTQMSLAIAEAMISGEPWTPMMLADRFVLAFKRDPRKGYAGHFYRFLKEVNSGGEFLEKIKNSSDKSGAAMRAGPLGVLPRIGDVLTKCRIQAALTHNTTDGMNAAMAASLLTHYFVHGLGPKATVGQFITDYVPGQWAVKWMGPVGARGWQSVRAAITSVEDCSSMTELLKRCISYTGDVDTVAAIALGAAAHCDEIVKDLPPALINGLENGTFGRDYLIDIDTQLMRLKNG